MRRWTAGDTLGLDAIDMLVKKATFEWWSSVARGDVLELTPAVTRWGTTSFDVTVTGHVGERQVFEAKNKAQEATGKAKEVAGDKTDNEELEREGKTDQSRANMKQAGEHAKDSAKNVRDAFKD